MSSGQDIYALIKLCIIFRRILELTSNMLPVFVIYLIFQMCSVSTGMVLVTVHIIIN